MKVVSQHDPDRRAAERVAAALALAGILMLPACASPYVGNAPAAVVEECELETAELTRRDTVPPAEEALPDEAGSESEVTTIDEARTAQREESGATLADWPEEALLYRCFVSRGVVLTDDQAAVLARWQGRSDATTPRDEDE